MHKSKMMKDYVLQLFKKCLTMQTKHYKYRNMRTFVTVYRSQISYKTNKGKTHKKSLNVLAFPVCQYYINSNVLCDKTYAVDKMYNVLSFLNLVCI